MSQLFDTYLLQSMRLQFTWDVWSVCSPKQVSWCYLETWSEWSVQKSHRCDPKQWSLTFERTDISVRALSEARHTALLMRSITRVTKEASFGQIWSRKTLKLERVLLWTQCSHSETFHRLCWTWNNGRIKARLHKFPPLTLFSAEVQ